MASNVTAWAVKAVGEILGKMGFLVSQNLIIQWKQIAFHLIYIYKLPYSRIGHYSVSVSRRVYSVVLPVFLPSKCLCTVLCCFFFGELVCRISCGESVSGCRLSGIKNHETKLGVAVPLDVFSISRRFLSPTQKNVQTSPRGVSSSSSGFLFGPKGNQHGSSSGLRLSGGLA